MNARRIVALHAMALLLPCTDAHAALGDLDGEPETREFDLAKLTSEPQSPRAEPFDRAQGLPQERRPTPLRSVDTESGASVPATPTMPWEGCDGVCPGPPTSGRWSDHASREDSRFRGFFDQAATIPTELAIVAGYYAIQIGSVMIRDTSSFRFHDEGWFGKETRSLGVDKLAHAYNTYLLAEILHARLHRNTQASHGDARTAALLAVGFTALNEVADAVEPGSGYSMQDITMNLVGAGFSVLRNTVPGLKEKLAYKVEIVPNGDVYTFAGSAHWSQLRFMLSLKGAGFLAPERSPLGFFDLQVGYWASDFHPKARAAGKEPHGHLFVGVGLNLGEILFGRSRSPLGKAARTVLDYVQLPYTSLRVETNGRVRASGSPR